MKPVPDQTPWDLSAESAIRCRFSLTPTSNSQYHRILTVHFCGLYRMGCQGGPDATYMEAMTAAALVATRPEGLIFDFTDLDYRWGDDLESLYDICSNWPYRGADLPYAVVLGKDCRTAVISLACQGQVLQEPKEWMFDTFAEVWQHVDSRIRP